MKSLKPIDLSPRGSDTAHALAWGLIAAAVLIVGIVVGSRGFKDFDPALVSYAGATVFSAFGLGYRYSMWLRRPPTRLYWFRGWQIFLQPARLPGNLARPGRHFLEQRRAAALHRAPLQDALDRTLVSRLGLPDRRGCHVSLVVRLDTLRDRSRQSGNLSRIRFRHPRRQLSRWTA